VSWRQHHHRGARHLDGTLAYRALAIKKGGVLAVAEMLAAAENKVIFSVW
jgi:hypothetical protein